MQKKNQRKTLLFIVGYVFVVAVLLVALSRYINNKMEQQLLNTLSDLSNQSVARVCTELHTRIQALNNLARQVEGMQDYHNVAKELAGVSEVLGFREIGLALPNGTAYMSTDTVYNVSERDYFQKGMQGEEYITSTFEDMRDGADVNVFVVPLYDSQSQVKGVLFGIDESDRFFEIFDVPLFEEAGYVFLADSQGNIFRSDAEAGAPVENMFDLLAKTPENKQVMMDMAEAMAKGESISLYIYRDGYRYVNITPVPYNDWWIVTGVPSSFLEQQAAPIKNITQMIMVLLTAVSVAVLLILIRISNETERKLQKIAYIDKVTGLYNAEYIEENFQQLCQKHKETFSVLVVGDVRRFKFINEIYGETVGDYLLQQIGSILQAESNRAGELAVHMHGDEFAVLLSCRDTEDLQLRMESIYTKIKQLRYKDNEIRIDFTVGIYEIDCQNDTFAKAVSCANIAQKEAKKCEGRLFSHYNKQMRDGQMEQQWLLEAITEGFERKEFKAWFQPQYNAATGDLEGAEALARWHKEDGRVLTPFYFVEFCEKNGLIQKLDLMIFEDVCRQLHDWNNKGLPCLPISVNLSRAYLNNRNSIYQLKDILDQYQVSSSLIKLEITESALADNHTELLEAIQLMHQLGFAVALDDFGVGYSSLTALKHSQFDILKLDKSFLDELRTVKGDKIVLCIIELAKSLGMKIVAEGVETKEQYEFLKKHHCDILQGFYLGKPMESSAFIKMSQQSVFCKN